MNVTVIGSGYVGLVVGACLSETGNRVTCADIDAEKISRLNAGEVPIYEPGLDRLISRNLSEGRLQFTTDVGKAIESARVVFIAVGTPPDEDGAADLQHVLSVAGVIGQHMRDEKVVITKSTVPVGTAAKVRSEIERYTDESFHVCSNPEFLKEGAAVDDFMRPDRVVCGIESDAARPVLEELYEPFVRSGKPLIFMDIASAELTKYAANAMLAMRISFMNQVALLCEVAGADVNLIRKGIGSDGRIGPAFLYAGAGYGGSCFPKDVRALIRTGVELGVDLSILREVHDSNERQKQLIGEKVMARFGSDLSGRRFAVWGLAVAQTWHLGDRVEYAVDEYEACNGADALIIMTEWQQYRRPEWSRVQAGLKNSILFDGRNLFKPSRMREAGFEYYPIGMEQVR